MKIFREKVKSVDFSNAALKNFLQKTSSFTFMVLLNPNEPNPEKTVLRTDERTELNSSEKPGIQSSVNLLSSW